MTTADNVLMQQAFRFHLVNGAFISFLVPIPALASFFIAWVARRNHQPTLQAYQTAGTGKSSLPDRLILAAHVILWATFLSLLCGAVTAILLGFDSPSIIPTSRSTARLLAGILTCNAIVTLIFQSTGEGVLVYQFLRMYPDSKPRYRVLPLAAILILIRFVSQTFNQVLHVALTIFPNSEAISSWLEWQTAGAWVYSISLTSLILLLSASFVFKLWSRWREYRASVPRHHRDYTYTKLLPHSMHRIRGVLAASWHHTVLSSISVLVMTVSFSLSSTSEAARWVNAIFISVFKLVFSLGIAQSLFHLCLDTPAGQPLAANDGMRRPQRNRAARGGLLDEFGSDATLTSTMEPSFHYNSWCSQPVPLGPVASESVFEPAYDSRSTHYTGRGRGFGYETSWPIQSINIESDLGVPNHSQGYTRSQPRRGRSPPGFR